jgi:xanthine dehydrogenase YagT iron-sulfur-binding subunit
VSTEIKSGVRRKAGDQNGQSDQIRIVSSGKDHRNLPNLGKTGTSRATVCKFLLRQINTSVPGRNLITGTAVNRILPPFSLLSRRRSLNPAGVTTMRLESPSARADKPPESASKATESVALTVNGRLQVLDLDPRTTLLDALREHLALTGTKKGCDQGQCGACTVIVNGQRINSCLSLAVMHAGDEIVTVEGLMKGDDLHPMQAAFVHHDGLQCGYCTPGQICSAVALLAEHEAGWPSYVTADLAPAPALTDAEIAERMSGNICRCSAYPNIVAAIRDVAKGGRP